MGISEAILHLGNAKFTFIKSQVYSIFWVITENDRNLETGLLIKKFWDKHMTDIFRYEEQIVAVTLRFKK